MRWLPHCSPSLRIIYLTHRRHVSRYCYPHDFLNFIQACSCCYCFNLGIYCHSPTCVLSCLPTPYDSHCACTARRFSQLRLRAACTYHFRYDSAVLFRRFNPLCYHSCGLSLCLLYTYLTDILFIRPTINTTKQLRIILEVVSAFGTNTVSPLRSSSGPHSLLHFSHHFTFHAIFHRRAYIRPTHVVRHVEPF